MIAVSVLRIHDIVMEVLLKTEIAGIEVEKVRGTVVPGEVMMERMHQLLLPHLFLKFRRQ